MSRRRTRVCRRVAGWRRLVPLTVFVGAAMLIAASSAAATAQSTTTYKSQQTFALPPASSYQSSSGGDGWDLGFTQTNLYNVFHHQSTLRVDCHSQSTAAECAGYPELITDASGDNFATSSDPGVYLDPSTGKLYVYVSRSSDNTAGVACIDTTNTAAPFCGFTALSAVGEGPQNGIADVGDLVHVGHYLYAFNYADYDGQTGTLNTMLCYDLSTGAACAGQPFTINLGPSFTNGNGNFPGPSEALIGSEIIVPINRNGIGDEIACFNTSTQADCGGSFPVTSIPGGASNYAAPYPLLDSSGNLKGFCIPNGTDPCFDLTGASVSTPANMTSAIGYSGGIVAWDGPAVVIGARVYLADFSNSGSSTNVDCYDYSTGNSCDNFPVTLQNMSHIYTVNPDPQRPTCLWANSDSGSAQIQNFDAYSTGNCGLRVLTSQFIVNKPACYPVSYQSLQVNSPSPSSYSSGNVQVEDSDGNPIGSPVPLDSTGTANLSGLGNLNQNGLPQFLITLNGETGTPSNLTATLTYSAPYDPSCAESGVTPTPTPTTTSTNLSGGGESGSSIVVPGGTPVTDQASLSGNDAGQAGGTITYSVYSDPNCQTLVAGGSSQSITTPGSPPASSSVTLSQPGTYYWVASYSGDPGNNASASQCGSEVETVGSSGPCTMTSGPNTIFSSGGQSIDIQNALSTNLHAPQQLVLSSASGTAEYFKLTSSLNAVCKDNPSYPTGEDGPNNKFTASGIGSFGTDSSHTQPGYAIQVQIGDYGDSGQTDNTAADSVTFQVVNGKGQTVWQGTGTLSSGIEEISTAGTANS